MSRSLYITGCPGAGKSTVGALAARRLNLPFFDLDEMIVQMAGRPIPEIFAEQGEAGFRQAERRALEASLTLPRAVFGTGGGILTHPGNWERMDQGGVVVFLDRPLALILGDIDPSGRPMLSKSSLESLYNQRIDAYRACCHATALNDADLETAAARVAAAYRGVIA